MDRPSLTKTATPTPGAQPVRTCVGCRTREARSALVRLVLEGDRIVVDPTGSAPGRGAWLHPGSDCLAQALRRKALTRALRAPHADASALEIPALRLG